MAHIDRIEFVLESALLIPSEVERRLYLDQECGEDIELRSQVEALIRNHFEAQSFLVDRDAQVITESFPNQASIGSWIGPYKLLQKIGEGGMGIVYQAEQSAPLRRQLAVKIIRSGMDISQVIARFEHERQALALMDHPNIARVIDGGMTEDGRPWFAMELVKGVSITSYCDQQRLSVSERVELFTQVCLAVQHAHQKGIVHRDLKPSNVLVAQYDGRPVPKVIDFGVAKALGQRLVEKSMFTELGQIIGTLEYMSPEQAESNNLDVDTRADIYSLGVILYELLTGSPPFSSAELKKVGLNEVFRMIKEVEPKKPSTKITSSEESLPGIAAQRRTEPQRLARTISGDLDCITMKCLEKERARRYATANDLAQDLTRYITDKPVQARPPTLRYRLHKFVRQHRGPVATICMIMLILITATSVSVWQAGRAFDAESRAAVQRDEARQQRRRMRESLDALLAPEGLRFLTAQANLTEGQKAFLQNVIRNYEILAADTATDLEGRLMVAQASTKIGQFQTELGQLIEAEKSITTAIGQLNLLSHEYPNDEAVFTHLLKAYTLWGTLCEITNNHAGMENASLQGIRLYEKRLTYQQLPVTNSSWLAQFYRRLGLALRFQSRYHDSVAAYQRAVDIQSMVIKGKPNDRDRIGLAGYLLELGYSLHFAQRPQESKTAFEQAAAAVETLPESYTTDQTNSNGDEPAELAEIYNKLASAYAEIGNWMEVVRKSQILISLWESRLTESPGVPVYRRQLATAYGRAGDAHRELNEFAEADRAFVRAIELVENLAHQQPENTALQFDWESYCVSRAITLLMLNKREEGQLLYQSAIGAENLTRQLTLRIHWAYGLARAGDSADAIAQIEAISKIDLHDQSKADLGWAAYGCASIYAIASATTEEKATVDHLSTTALAWLRQAISDGWHDPEYLSRDSDWTALRTNSEFQELVHTIGIPDQKSETR